MWKPLKNNSIDKGVRQLDKNIRGNVSEGLKIGLEPGYLQGKAAKAQEREAYGSQQRAMSALDTAQGNLDPLKQFSGPEQMQTRVRDRQALAAQAYQQHVQRLHDQYAGLGRVGDAMGQLSQQSTGFAQSQALIPGQEQEVSNDAMARYIAALNEIQMQRANILGRPLPRGGADFIQGQGIDSMRNAAIQAAMMAMGAPPTGGGGTPGPGGMAGGGDPFQLGQPGRYSAAAAGMQGGGFGPPSPVGSPGFQFGSGDNGMSSTSRYRSQMGAF